MPITLNHRALSALAKSVSGDMKHTQKLDAFAKALGYATSAALMERARAEEPRQEIDTARLVRNALEEAASLAARLRDSSAVSTAEMSRRILALGDPSPGLDLQPGTPVLGRITTDDGKMQADVDARAWLLSLNNEEIRGLIVEDYNTGYVSDGLLAYAQANCPDEVAELSAHLEALSRIGGDAGFAVELREADVIRFLAAHRPDPHGGMESMIADGLIDVDIEALRGAPVSVRNDVLITVSCLVGRDQLDPEDQDPDGDDAIGGHFRYTVVSDAPISAPLAFERALDAYHDDYAIANLDHYEIVPSLFVEENAPDELVDHGTIEVDAPLGFDEEPDADGVAPSPA
ncbi:hypothetical protein [Paracoccus sp. ME4]|uniref:hypothetical protein n=1 Tax=Paracoccus sp. ME4 TaxID=3138066 RepID=UPI00398A56E1